MLTPRALARGFSHEHDERTVTGTLLIQSRNGQREKNLGEKSERRTTRFFGMFLIFDALLGNTHHDAKRSVHLTLISNCVT